MKASCALLVLFLSACASTPGPTVESAQFAPALAVDLAEMQSGYGGLRWRDLGTGNGGTARSGKLVSVYYNLWLADGTPVDSTQPPRGPVRFELGKGEVIQGWERGIIGMRAGGRRQLVVPPSLGYGNTKREGIPPRSVLVFVIDVVDVK